MKLDFFFQGTLRKEEVASAFLATALVSSRRFRRHFFEKVAPEEAERLANADWNVRVEERRVDVTLASENAIVIIENKISAAAKQDEQLVRYYIGALEETPANKRIFAVYLSPGQVGKSEVDVVREEIAARSDRGADRAVHVSCEALAAFEPAEPEDREIGEALAQVLRVTAAARMGKYDRSGDRGVVGPSKRRYSASSPPRPFP